MEINDVFEALEGGKDTGYIEGVHFYGHFDAAVCLIMVHVHEQYLGIVGFYDPGYFREVLNENSFGFQ